MVSSMYRSNSACDTLSFLFVSAILNPSVELHDASSSAELAAIAGTHAQREFSLLLYCLIILSYLSFLVGFEPWSLRRQASSG